MLILKQVKMRQKRSTQITLQHTFIVSPIEKGLETCTDNPLRTFPRISLDAKAVATPADTNIRNNQIKDTEKKHSNLKILKTCLIYQIIKSCKV